MERGTRNLELLWGTAVFRLSALALALVASPVAALEPPASADKRLVVELFAAAPDIVHPIATDFDAKGRLLVVESHTHFRPANYAGPKFDRVRVLEDTDGDGRADRFTTFFEGTTFTMDVAAHPDGSVYVASRNEILRLRDTDGDGVADEKTRVVFLDTAGNYPHNGLSGLTFDSRGDLFFGMGENLGAAYKLSGTDGTTLACGGEGGNVFHCTADGKKLGRVATGFWNPFGAGRDIFGRLFVVDNDPDSSPPCRLVQVVEGGDYGFQFRYGRSGRHVFQAWNGELPGTLPYVTGTGESPCEVVSYESDGLPAEYRGSLLVPAWADHRVERYVLKPNGAGLVGERKAFVQGGKDFYPSGLGVAPDGSVFVTDWGSRSYELHGKGAVWHVRELGTKLGPRVNEPRQALLSMDRPTREKAARALAKVEAGRAYLREQLAADDVRVRAAALTALIDTDCDANDLRRIASGDAKVELRALAVRALVARRNNVGEFLDEKCHPAVRAAALAGLQDNLGHSPFRPLLTDPDPFLRHAAIQRQARTPYPVEDATAKERVSYLLAARASDARRPVRLVLLERYLKDPDPDVRFLAVKWVADEKLTAFRPRVAEALKSPKLDPREFVALATALARLDDKPVNEDGLADYFIGRLTDTTAPLPTRVMALRGVPATHAKLKTEQLVALLAEADPGFRVEVLRALKDRADAKAAPPVREIARNAKQPTAVRAQAILTLSALAPPDVGFLTGLAGGDDAVLAHEALRALDGATLSSVQKRDLFVEAEEKDDRTDLVYRVLGKEARSKRPPATDTQAWLKLLDGPADPDAGRRIFENPRLTNCSACHRVEGRGANVGPDLSLIGRTDRKWIVESILQPSAVVAPHFQAWKIDLTDGRVVTGLLVGTHGDESIYLDPKGQRVKVLATDVAESNPARTSVMPEGLLDRLTDQEARDLVAYLAGRK